MNLNILLLGGLANLLILFVLGLLVKKVNGLSCKLDKLVPDDTCLERRGVFSQRIIDAKQSITQLFDRTDKTDIDVAFLKGRHSQCGDGEKIT